MRSLFATPDEETSVTFSFEHQQMSYEIERKPEQVLAKRKGNGTKKQAAKVTLTIFDGKGKEIKQITKRTEADQVDQRTDESRCETVFSNRFTTPRRIP